MHVCFVGQEIHPPWIRGDPQLFKGIINALKREERVEISLVTNFSRRKDYSNNEKEFEKFTEGLENVILVKSLGDHNYNPVLFHPNTLLLEMASKKLAKDEDIDIFHLGSVNASIFAPLFKLDISRSHKPKLIRHIFMFLQTRPGRFSTSLLRNTYSNFIDGFAVTTNTIREEVSNLAIRKNKIFVIPPIINTNFFRPLDLPTNISGDPVILYMGSISPERFPISILKMLKNLKDNGLNPMLLAIGRYEFEREWINEITKKASKVNLDKNISMYIKALDEIEKVNLYNSADIVIFPFTGFVGATQPPLSLLEAMSCGKIVVATKTQDTQQVVKHGYNGLFINDLNPLQLAEIILVLTSQKAKFIGYNARKTILDKFSEDRVTGKILKMYNRVLNEH